MSPRVSTVYIFDHSIHFSPNFPNYSFEFSLVFHTTIPRVSIYTPFPYEPSPFGIPNWLIFNCIDIQALRHLFSIRQNRAGLRVLQLLCQGAAQPDDGPLQLWVYLSGALLHL